LRKNSIIDESCTWINEIDYNYSKVNLIEAEIGDESGINKSYVFITDIKITQRSANKVVSFCRSRWKIENQGFK
jgi:hypothetical protein